MSLDDRDSLLVERLKAGDMKALGEMYIHYGAMVKGALLRYAPEMAGADVDEVCQDVFMALNESIGRYEEQLKFKNWLFGIAVKKSRTWRRNTWLRRKLLDTRRGEVEVTALPSTATPDSTAEHMDEITHALGALSTKQREVVLLHTVDGLTCEEIAEVLNIKVGVVWSRLHRARHTLMKRREGHDSARVFQGEL